MVSPWIHFFTHFEEIKKFRQFIFLRRKKRIRLNLKNNLEKIEFYYLTSASADKIEIQDQKQPSLFIRFLLKQDPQIGLPDSFL